MYERYESSMKIIALFPVKNDAWILPVTIPQLKLFADEIICLDGGSTDGTKELLESYGVVVHDQDLTNINYSSWRQELLDAGRQRGGTHFIWLDADEAFTSNFLPHFIHELTKLKPGQKLVMKWICLWKSARVQRIDPCVWSNLYKDFVFCDDGTSMFGTTMLHEGRTPGDTTAESSIIVNPTIGAVLHFQFAAFTRFQIKQVFQRCREYVLGHGTARRLNHKYRETLDDEKAATEKIPTSWLSGIEGIDSIVDTDSAWYHTEIINYFNKKGIEFFEPLEIWHVEKYKNMFIEKVGRSPHSLIYPKIVIYLNQVRKNILTTLSGTKLQK